MGNSRAIAKSHCISSSVTPMQATDDAIVLVMFGLLCQHKIHPSQLKSRVRMALASNTAGLVWAHHQPHQMVRTFALRQTLPFTTCISLLQHVSEH
jgi:hypothetical protein